MFAAESPRAEGALTVPGPAPAIPRAGAARTGAGLPSLIANLDFPAIPHSGIRGNKITDLFTLFVQLMR